MRRAIEHRKAFTLLELIVILTIVALVIALLIPVMTSARAKANAIKCTGRLGCMGSAFRIYATDHGDRFPWQVATNEPMTLDSVLNQIRGLSNELSTPLILVCPADKRKPALDWQSLSATNLSYFVGIGATEALPDSILGGDRNIFTNGVRIGTGIVKLPTNLRYEWDNTIHRSLGYCITADGGWKGLVSSQLQDEITNSGQTFMTWAVP